MTSRSKPTSPAAPRRRPRITRLDRPDGRYYEIDGDLYPSVTHILSCIAKPALVAWAARTERQLVLDVAAEVYEELLRTPVSRTTFATTVAVRLGERAHKRFRARATDIGTQAHRLIEWQLRRELGHRVDREPEVGEEARLAVLAWQDWRQRVDVKPLFIEQVVYSQTHQYAGTMDLLALVDGHRMVLDFKTSRAIYGEAHLQNVAYQQALVDMGHEPPDGGLIVRIPKEPGDIEVAPTPPRDELWPVFLAIRRLWSWWSVDQQHAARGRR